MRFTCHLMQDKNRAYIIGIDRDGTETMEQVLYALKKRCDFNIFKNTIVLTRDVSENPNPDLALAATRLFADHCKIVAFYHNPTDSYRVEHSVDEGLIGTVVDGKTIPYPQ